MGSRDSISIEITVIRNACLAVILVSIVSLLPLSPMMLVVVLCWTYLANIRPMTELDLPEYEDYEALRKQLYTAMTAGSEYFGFA